MLSHVHDAVLWSQGLSPHREQKCIVGDSCLTVELLKLKFQDTGFISCFHGFSILMLVVNVSCHGYTSDECYFGKAAFF